MSIGAQLRVRAVHTCEASRVPVTYHGTGEGPGLVPARGGAVETEDEEEGERCQHEAVKGPDLADVLVPATPHTHAHTPTRTRTCARQE